MKATSVIAATFVALATMGTQAFADDDEFQGTAKDAWLTGKIETVYLLNRHLNGFSIDTDVENGVVHLTGAVESDIDRDLAEQLAANVDGVTEVRNDLQVEGAAADSRDVASDEEIVDGDGRTFGTWVDDATTTAAVKSRLVANSNTKGLEIDVDTNKDIVTLSGRVETNEEKQLAEQIAKDTGDVSDVRNNLVVDPEQPVQ